MSSLFILTKYGMLSLFVVTSKKDISLLFLNQSRVNHMILTEICKLFKERTNSSDYAKVIATQCC